MTTRVHAVPCSTCDLHATGVRWGESVLDFTQAVEHHALVRLVEPWRRSHYDAWDRKALESSPGWDTNQVHPDDCVYWICAYANNQVHCVYWMCPNNLCVQWNLADDLATDPLQSSFFLAMNQAQCTGVLLVLDRYATPFTRIWSVLLQTCSNHHLFVTGVALRRQW